jgi:transporter family-2 protein
MKFLLALCALLAGLGIAAQTGMNAQVRASLGSGILGAVASFSVGLLTLLLITFVGRIPFPSAGSLAEVPTWAWFGGVFGAFFIVVITVSARELGAVPLLVLVTLGQVVGSVVLDHYGLLGMPVRPVSMMKLAACAMLVASVGLLAASEQ